MEQSYWPRVVNWTKGLLSLDKANVDTFSFVESPRCWIRALEASARQQLRIENKEFESGVEEGVDLGSGTKDSLLLNVVS